MTTPEDHDAYFDEQNRDLNDRLEIIRMKQKSGNVRDDSKLVCFLYLLARDVMTWGEIEEVLDVIAEMEDGVPQEYTNGWAAKWAQDAADRLLE